MILNTGLETDFKIVFKYRLKPVKSRYRYRNYYKPKPVLKTKNVTVKYKESVYEIITY